MWYRKKGSFPLMLGIDISNYSIKYSYDITNSILSNNISGVITHELSLIFKLDMAQKKEEKVFQVCKKQHSIYLKT